jgi:hypothetical protein
LVRSAPCMLSHSAGRQAVGQHEQCGWMHNRKNANTESFHSAGQQPSPDDAP